MKNDTLFDSPWRQIFKLKAARNIPNNINEEKLRCIFERRDHLLSEKNRLLEDRKKISKQRTQYEALGKLQASGFKVLTKKDSISQHDNLADKSAEIDANITAIEDELIALQHEATVPYIEYAIKLALRGIRESSTEIREERCSVALEALACDVFYQYDPVKHPYYIGYVAQIVRYALKNRARKLSDVKPYGDNSIARPIFTMISNHYQRCQRTGQDFVQKSYDSEFIAELTQEAFQLHVGKDNQKNYKEYEKLVRINLELFRTLKSKVSLNDQRYRNSPGSRGERADEIPQSQFLSQDEAMLLQQAHETLNAFVAFLKKQKEFVEAGSRFTSLLDDVYVPNLPTLLDNIEPYEIHTLAERMQTDPVKLRMDYRELDLLVCHYAQAFFGRLGLNVPEIWRERSSIQPINTILESNPRIQGRSLTFYNAYQLFHMFIDFLKNQKEFRSRQDASTPVSRYFAFLREESGYTQKTLAEELEVAISAISKFELGRSKNPIWLESALSLMGSTYEELINNAANNQGDNENNNYLIILTEVYVPRIMLSDDPPTINNLATTIGKNAARTAATERTIHKIICDYASSFFPERGLRIPETWQKGSIAPQTRTRNNTDKDRPNLHIGSCRNPDPLEPGMEPG